MYSKIMNRMHWINFNVVVIFIFLLLPPGTVGHDTIFPAEKLDALYPEALSFEQKDLYISDYQRARIEEKVKSALPEEDLKPSIYFVIVKQHDDSPPQKAAVIMFIDAYGEGGKIEIGVMVGRTGELMKMRVFENNESSGVSELSFLRQFEGKKASDPFVAGKDIAAPAGQEESAQAIASGVRRGVLIINELLRKK